MIKVKIDTPGEDTFYVEDGETVSYSDGVLEVLDLDDRVIAVFRSWIYALPATEGEALEVLQLEEENFGAVDVFEALENASPVHANSHGSYGLADDAIEGPSE